MKLIEKPQVRRKFTTTLKGKTIDKLDKIAGQLGIGKNDVIDALVKDTSIKEFVKNYEMATPRRNQHRSSDKDSKKTQYE